ncbi:PARP catalytic domain-containing protein [Mycena indigotica]|uniref:PARP catalytic domain-containing protein n=1 Tax=Mycena indigotica TaxID=2126181 RepID=A0A8H6T5Z6_9AGAR|nr:PARP catalytic domain-containing protein [Mycena indigotica]KAF7312710.1 PARP catalytic domain-containing protein [Mycena indigotica]
MASTIPLAFSLLHTFATQYPSGKQLWTPPSAASTQQPAASSTTASTTTGMGSSTTTTSQPQSVPAAPPAPSAPINVSTSPPRTAASAAVAAVANIGTSPPASSNINANLCDNCQVRPKYSDGSRIHPYCSKGCANQAKLPAQPPSSGNNLPKSANCDFCGVRPKHFDGKRTHPFCSKACSKNAAAQNPQLKPNAKGMCHAPGCQKPAHTNADGSSGSYCSLAHKTLGETICLMCKQAAKLSQSHFCSTTCADNAEKSGPMLLEVPVGHATFKSVADQFKASWRHANKYCPPVRRVYKIVSTQTSMANYKTYQTTVESAGHFVASGRSPGNENRRWHGTKRECNVGDKGQAQLCQSTKCSLCCIIKSSFDISLWGTKTGWGRFGKGIYTSSTSSKSNDYSHNECSSNLKAILLNKVIVGRGCKLTHDNVALTAPPTGYDSVLAEKGGSLNYDELVVYSNDAIRPSFLVMYEP